MTSIQITPKDNTQVFVSSENEGILHDLQDYLTFFADNYRHHPKFKFGTWDGKIRLYSPYNRTMLRGLVHRVVQWGEDMGYEVEVDPSLVEDTHTTAQEIAAWVEPLQLSADKDGEYVPITPHTFQWMALYHTVNLKRAVFEASTSGGKSLIAYLVCRWLLDHDEADKILIITDGIGLVGQLAGNFDEYSHFIDWNAEDHVHQIYTGQDKDVDKPIYISTWQSMADMPASYLSQFNAVIVDEAHKVKAVSFDKIMNKCRGAEYRIGLTGTLQDALCHKFKIEGLLGQAIKLLSNYEARKQGIANEVEVEGIIFEYSETERKQLAKENRITPEEKKAGKKDKSFQNEIDLIINHPQRRKFICDLVSIVEGNNIVLFNKIEHGMAMLEQFRKDHPEYEHVFWITGDVSKGDREDIVEKIKKLDNSTLFATFGTFSTGQNVPALNNLFLATPVDSVIRLLQSLGRLGRKSKGKGVAKVYHFGDNLKQVRKNAKDNHTLRHFKNCINRYDKERIPYHLSRARLT